MTISYPRDLRTLFDAGVRFHKPTFDLVPRGAVVNLPNRTQVMETAPAIWKASFQTVPLNRALFDEASAWLDSLGGARSFLAFDMFRRWPRAHAAGGVSATGTVTSYPAANKASLAGLSGVTLSAGDRIGFEQSGKYRLVRILETVTASGGAMTVEFAPSLPPGWFTTSAVVRINKPVCEMILTPGQGISRSDLTTRDTLAFSAVQRL